MRLWHSLLTHSFWKLLKVSSYVQLQNFMKITETFIRLTPKLWSVTHSIHVRRHTWVVNTGCGSWLPFSSSSRQWPPLLRVAGAGSSATIFSTTLPADVTSYRTVFIHWSPWISGSTTRCQYSFTPQPTPSAPWYPSAGPGVLPTSGL